MNITKRVFGITALSSGTSAINVSPTPVTLPNLPTNLSDLLDGTYTTVSVFGSASLTGAYNISPTGTPATGRFVEIYWKASLGNGASNPVVVFGKTVPAELITSGSKFKVECLYNGIDWNVNILPDDAGIGIVGTARVADSAVTTAKIADDAVTLAKMASGTTGSILAYNASGDIEEASMAADGKLLIGVTAGKGYTTAVLSGDATISTAGALTIANDAITTTKILDANVTAEKLSAGARKDSFSIRLDFDDASKLGGQIFLPVCYNCTVDAVKATLVGTAGSDLTTIIKDAGGTVMTGSQIDVPSATVVGNVITSTVTGNNIITGGTNMILEPSAAGTTTGHIHFTFCVTRNN